MADADFTRQVAHKYAFAGATKNGTSIFIDNTETGDTFDFPIYDPKAIDEIIGGMSSHDAVVVGMFIERNMRHRSKILNNEGGTNHA